MSVKAAMRCFGETRVVLSHKGRHEGIGRLDARDLLQSQLLDQAVLERLVRTFDTSFGRWRVGADTVDVELIKRPSELRMTVTAGGGCEVDAKDTGFVTV